MPEKFIGTETSKPAGNFNQYTSKCDLRLNGWALFRPENYILKLMEYDKEGEEVEVGHIVDWDDCPEDYVPPYNSLDDV